MRRPSSSGNSPAGHRREPMQSKPAPAVRPLSSRIATLVVLAALAFSATYGITRFIHNHPAGMVWIPGGEFTMGTDSDLGWPDEKPAHRVRVDGFWMDDHEVTNAEFAKFVDATHYVTTAEKPPVLEEIMKQMPPDTPPPGPDKLVPGSLVFTLTASGRCRSTMFPHGGNGFPAQLAASRRPGQRSQRPRKSSRRTSLLGRCRGLRQLGRQTIADRSRVGIRRPRRAGGQRLRVGRPSAGRCAHFREHLAGRVSLPQHKGRRFRAHRAGEIVPAQRLRPVRHGRQRVGVVLPIGST